MHKVVRLKVISKECIKTTSFIKNRKTTRRGKELLTRFTIQLLIQTNQKKNIKGHITNSRGKADKATGKILRETMYWIDSNC